MAGTHETNSLWQDIRHNQRTTTMEWTTDQQIQLQRHETEQHNRNQNPVRRKQRRKKKRTWLVLRNDNDVNIYYRFV